MTESRPAEVAAWVLAARHIVVLTGAGISTDSGIPDFRGPDGVWTRDPRAERLSNIGYYVADPAVRRESWQRRLAHPAWDAVPNAGHDALTRLERSGRLDVLITQNIDGLHQAAGSSAERVIEIHGSMRESICLSCGDRAPMLATLNRVRAGDQDPACLVCGGILKSATVSFGQNLYPGVLDEALDLVTSADLVLAIGSSLQVYPAADVPASAARSGIPLVIVNDEATPLDAMAALVVRGRAGDVLPPAVAAALGASAQEEGPSAVAERPGA